MKIKCNKLYINYYSIEESSYERYIYINKEYYVLAIRFIEKGGEVLIISEYLKEFLWLPLLGLEFTDNFIPDHWYCDYFSNDEYYQGICYCSNKFDIHVLNNGYTAYYENLYPLIAEELKILEQQTKENDEKNPKNEVNKKDSFISNLKLKRFCPEHYKYLKPTRFQLNDLVNKIILFLKKYNLDPPLYFNDPILKCIKSTMDEVELANMIAKHTIGPYLLSDEYIPDTFVNSKEEFYRVNNEFDILKEQLKYCCEYIIAKNSYLKAFSSD